MAGQTLARHVNVNFYCLNFVLTVSFCESCNMQIFARCVFDCRYDVFSFSYLADSRHSSTNSRFMLNFRILRKLVSFWQFVQFALIATRLYSLQARIAIHFFTRLISLLSACDLRVFRFLYNSTGLAGQPAVHHWKYFVHSQYTFKFCCVGRTVFLYNSYVFYRNYPTQPKLITYFSIGRHRRAVFPQEQLSILSESGVTDSTGAWSELVTTCGKWRTTVFERYNRTVQSVIARFFQIYKLPV